jgi:uncharacterized membrane protein YdjX (TVP38/TMEM64 family)
VPVLPFTAINYVAGMSSVRFRDFVIGTAVGIVPGALAYAAVGAFGLGLGRWPLAISAVALVAAGVAGAVWSRRWEARQGRLVVGR